MAANREQYSFDFDRVVKVEKLEKSPKTSKSISPLLKALVCLKVSHLKSEKSQRC